MSVNTKYYQTLFGLNNINASTINGDMLKVKNLIAGKIEVLDAINVQGDLHVDGNTTLENATINSLIIPANAQQDYVLTSDNDGNANWKPIPELQGDVTGPYSMTQVESVGGETAEDVASAPILANNVTNENQPSQIIRRDEFGDFEAGVITADLNGNASTADDFNGSLDDEVTGTQKSTMISNESVIGKLLTGFLVGSGVVTAADTILQAFQKIVGSLNTHTTQINTLNNDVDSIEQQLENIIIPSGTSDAVANTLVKRDANASTAVKDLKVNRLLSDLNSDVILNMPSSSVFLGRGIASSVGNNIIGAGNTGLGFQAGLENRSGNTYNTFIGYGTGPSSSSLVMNNSTAIGNGAKCTASNQVVIGNSSVTSTVLRGAITAPTLTVTGTATAANLTVTGTLSPNNLTVTGDSAMNTVNTSGLVRTQTVMAKGAINPSEQGAWLSWNRSGGGGETNFINARGFGVGGWNWMTFGTNFNYESTPMTLSPQGNLVTTGTIQGRPTYCRQAIQFTWRQQIIPGEDQVQFDTYDVGNGWMSDQNGQFVYTAPVAGTYRYSFFMRLNSTAPNTMTHLIVAPDTQHFETVVEYSLESLFCTGTGYVNVNAGDEIYLLCWCTRKPIILPPPNDTVKFGCTVSGGVPTFRNGCYLTIERVN